MTQYPNAYSVSPRLAAWLAIVAMLVLACLACSGDDDHGKQAAATDAGPDPSTGDAVKPADRCFAFCKAFAICEAFPLQGCEGPIDCAGWPAKAWRPEVASAHLECIKQCPKDAKECESAAFDAAGAARAVDKAYAGACAKKRESCSDNFKNDTCEEAPLYEESAVKSAMACLEMPCAQVADCVDAALE